MSIREINSLVLAYLGDTVYENYIRMYLINLGIYNVNELQKKSIAYVSAKSQAYYLNELIQSEFLTEEEIIIVKRARNCKSNSHPKNCDIITYKHATGLEALIGYLKLEKKERRIQEIMNYIVGDKIC